MQKKRFWITRKSVQKRKRKAPERGFFNAE